MPRVCYDFTNEGLKELLSDLLSQPDFLTVSRWDIVSSFLCSHLRSFGYVAMTHEELILRQHVDVQTTRIRHPHARLSEECVFQDVEYFKLRNLFNLLGIPEGCIKPAVKNLIDLGILKSTTAPDPQCDFPATKWADKSLSLGAGLHKLRYEMK